MQTPPSPEREALLEVLERHGVHFILIGAAAAQTLGWRGQTADVDITPAPDTANLERLCAALRELEADLAVGTAGAPGERRVPLAHWTPEHLRAVGVWTTATRHGGLDVSLVPSGTQGYGDLRHAATRERVAGTQSTLLVIRRGRHPALQGRRRASQGSAGPPQPSSRLHRGRKAQRRARRRPRRPLRRARRRSRPLHAGQARGSSRRARRAPRRPAPGGPLGSPGAARGRLPRALGDRRPRARPRPGAADARAPSARALRASGRACDRGPRPRARAEPRSVTACRRGGPPRRPHPLRSDVSGSGPRPAPSPARAPRLADLPPRMCARIRQACRRPQPERFVPGTQDLGRGCPLAPPQRVATWPASACATTGLTTSPPRTLTPAARPRRSAIAPSSPRSAIATT